ncbi:DNA processing protein DprA [Meiothermus luteus]|jgi:DNA processing protein|uniref:DNA processing protein DprA n=1 Tax=Meiothermus luteus TaxID=2026184 RepID=A0A399EWV5_9DEIN|nr:DNA-processing protein DprA [Meiothermus luteus]RIH89044.1 DNA processing protein DprA [Meiothermus luteus]RMH58265.1 MAG: DNA-protecting protein DprA [Deinococcota bacterium]
MPDPLALALTPGVGPKRLALALKTDLSPEAIVKTLGSEVGRAYHQALREGRAEREREKAQRMGLRLIGLWEEAYPERLRHLDSPPTVLYLKGRLPEIPHNIGIVGTRRASPWAIAWTQRVARELAEAGVGVISGLALGIDAAAHRGALEGGGYTLGVLGSGMDRLYPPQNRTLAEQMHLLSEFPLGTPPQAGLFPRRNRIVAALAKAVLVVEAGEKSGSLITARFALELGRDVLAVPGRPGDTASLGCNRLIQDGAGLVMGTEDVLNALGLRAPAAKPPSLQGPEARVYRALLELSEALPDDLAQATGLPPSEVLSLLTLLEIKGLAQANGGRYRPL